MKIKQGATIIHLLIYSPVLLNVGINVAYYRTRKRFTTQIKNLRSQWDFLPRDLWLRLWTIPTSYWSIDLVEQRNLIIPSQGAN